MLKNNTTFVKKQHISPLMTDGMDRLPGGSPMQLKRVTREARNTCDASRGVGASESPSDDVPEASF